MVLYLFSLQAIKAGLQCILNFCELVTEWHFNVIFVFIYLLCDAVVSMPKAFLLGAV